MHSKQSFQINNAALVARGGRRPRVGFWRLLWARLWGRCGFCGGDGFAFCIEVRPWPAAPWEQLTHQVQCPCCLRGGKQLT